ncbi:MAG: hypothetical protein F4Z00_00535 [Acidimicrobiaceae bacterium]|nr:hypothetical protein [Acidimicrobiaceae bacterium]MXZ64030.1 hypothetical protein [Acidimicrobiaceae bacterium]MYF31908.1 hypothetical protein [Acidimicrobiaceae bacterium]MYG77021.1 hypothetical protein [Acidimicrobiaceae bacterium]
MSRLTALVPGAVGAAALGRAWPDDVNGQVRCIDEGSRALGLACCCAPWTGEAQDPDSVTTGLVATPGALPVLGVVPGPLSSELLSGIHRRGGKLAGSSAIQDVQDLLDDASDAAVDRLRALGACGVRRAAVMEDATISWAGEDAAAEAHRPLLNAAAHLRIDLVLVAGGPEVVASLGYDRWVSGRGCSLGLGYLPAEAFDSAAALERGLDRTRAAGDPGEVITPPLDAGVAPELVRHASRVLAGTVVRP